MIASARHHEYANTSHPSLLAWMFEGLSCAAALVPCSSHYLAAESQAAAFARITQSSEDQVAA